MASELPNLEALLRPLHPVHLGILTRCYLLSASPVRCEDVQRLLRASFGLEVTVQDITTVYANLERDCPDLLGGARPTAHALVGEVPFIEPAVNTCVDCELPLVPGKPGETMAFLLDQGWTSVRWRSHRCPACKLVFSNVWKARPDARTRCCAVVAPEDAAFFQIVACPRKNSKAFIETRVLWLLRAAVLRSKTAFSGFIQMLADLHSAPADRENDCYRFEHHWLLLEILTLLWAHAPGVAQTTWWPLDTKHAPWLQASSSFHAVLHMVASIAHTSLCMRVQFLSIFSCAVHCAPGRSRPHFKPCSCKFSRTSVRPSMRSTTWITGVSFAKFLWSPWMPSTASPVLFATTAKGEWFSFRRCNVPSCLDARSHRCSRRSTAAITNRQRVPIRRLLTPGGLCDTVMRPEFAPTKSMAPLSGSLPLTSLFVQFANMRRSWLRKGHEGNVAGAYIWTNQLTKLVPRKMHRTLMLWSQS